MTKFSLALLGVMAFSAPALAQTAYPLPLDEPATTGTIARGQNNTGGDANVTVPFGATGADTFQSDSAVGGNANQPARSVPQGSGGGASGGNN
ncbi:hypothetical protein [Methylorubrum salsuginis]|uniref:Curli production assembly/transport component CsgF n=1 Tax=Methylorubrum salsuginis TaxID=414703 RepID=A0A1I4FJJ9_9HYPH|nr:hypothetical protein [Methylorubrum salsuginis]SFL16641.1 hypothetical protein SAMN04488125_11014 [Methylorubrum salsuginis]